MQPTRRFLARALVPAVFGSAVLAAATAAYPASPPTFTLTPLSLTDGSSEPEIAIGADGTTAMVSLQWLFDPTSFGTAFWTGVFGVPPTLQGVVDNTLQHPGKAVFGAGDADVDFGSTGKVHITTLIFLLKPIKGAQIGVSAISCPKPLAGSVQLDGCTSQIVDTTGSDRPWVSSDGSHVYLSYHDSGNSSLIHVQRSDDDGFEREFSRRLRRRHVRFERSRFGCGSGHSAGV